MNRAKMESAGLHKGKFRCARIKKLCAQIGISCLVAFSAPAMIL
jgi:hypothetical protein